jgi:hypothetical protein
VSSTRAKLETIAAAKLEISGAEIEIERLLREIPTAARAEKTKIPDVIDAAFSRLRAAKVTLADLEKLVAAEADESE